MEMFVSVLSAFKVILSQLGFKVILFSELIRLQGSVKEMAPNRLSNQIQQHCLLTQENES